MMKITRNSPCPCGRKNSTGRPVKFKRCCGAPGAEFRGDTPFGPVPDSVKAETDRMFAEEGYTLEFAEKLRADEKRRKKHAAGLWAGLCGVLGYGKKPK